MTILCTVTAQNDEPTSTMIVNPADQDVTLSYDLHPRNETPGWMIDLTSYGVQSIANGLVAGYSANIFNNNLRIIKNIMMNDDRSGTWYRCVIVRSIEGSHDHEVLESGNITILYVAGEYIVDILSCPCSYIAADPVTYVSYNSTCA